jgi:NH3-dependent NAD+ synthetase
MPRFRRRWSATSVKATPSSSRGGDTSLNDIIATPISPELLPTDQKGQIAQKTEDKIGPYELHDFFIYYFLRFGFSPSKIYYLATQAYDGRLRPRDHQKMAAGILQSFLPQRVQTELSPRWGESRHGRHLSARGSPDAFRCGRRGLSQRD